MYIYNQLVSVSLSVSMYTFMSIYIFIIPIYKKQLSKSFLNLKYPSFLQFRIYGDSLEK